jgi:hypothetical protein
MEIMKKTLEPIKQIPANARASAERDLVEREMAEAQKFLVEAPIPLGSTVALIKRVYDKEINDKQGSLWGAITVYELGRIHGIRSERKRRKKAQTVNSPVAV